MLLAVYPLLGRAYSQGGDLSSAAGVLRKAVDSNPADQESRYALGRTLVAMGQIDKGREELDKFDEIRQRVNSANNNYQTALSRLADGNFSEAEKLFRESVRLAPAYGPALHSLGALLLDRGSPEKALDFLRRAAEANPLNADTWYSLGLAYSKSGKVPEALDASNRAVILNEDDERYRQLLSDLRRRLNK
jgi:tetratricopeptide (TPR) repeat protein